MKNNQILQNFKYFIKINFIIKFYSTVTSKLLIYRNIVREVTVKFKLI